ncbi:lysine--tRNA ligase [Candidatus Woesebacteria bacterium RIFCSPHIGHO2_01_FULL_44_10]|uniref:Lysine--tRNA ligase n=1 Tax=Candidatus Woesebacteria bacterium RIFCSPLOWO2_01_FULL_44_14 TaxID=1802525 RepID=A0A1F8C0A3_9BACT|nr:MAG: lysine--tRNA ligase [Candidatus Woesebacteria bacterium RIFCSPHIGHO2_01_FULL_44_10]OGM55783.1 MAG: lysine--tRNA ligase [Candidatus Woesebacteria bacterium RIFCSPHIGHO2_12_FULL_44_11]OGM68978.1 MAG: lysine--tRNA ligase [Candidatus Woesebacteria bacterium RIFCSPLOWO2_01_FULL_44_14]
MTERLNLLREERLKQAQLLENIGIDPYPGEIPTRTHFNAEIVQNYSEHDDRSVSVVGRMTGVRTHGKRVFFDLEDESGKIQATITTNGVGNDMFAVFESGFGVSDFVGVSGRVFKTRMGEVTIDVEEFNMLAKALLPPPAKWGGITDTETRSRQRYLDLMMNKEVRERFKFRSKMVQFMRQRFLDLDCWEVETPVLDTTYGGASAKPFVTHHNALGIDLYLRISNELYLKRMLTGGFEGVFEFSRDFRNEGMDSTHNPEFTQVELYKAYTDYKWMMDMSETLMSDIVQKLLGATKVEFGGMQIDLSTPWRRLSIYDGLREYLGIDPETISDKELFELAKKEEIEETDRGYILVELFGKYVEPRLINPTFVIDYPESTSPLTKKHRTKKGLVERFECVVVGMEVMNCYTELNDPRKQRENFEAELKRRMEGDEEAMQTDDDFIIAMEYGMPPMGGIGISIDRWAMILTNAEHIREVITFPTMKPRKG